MTDSVSLDDALGIQQLVARYIHIVDDAAWERLGDVFVNEGVCDYSTFGLPVLNGLTEIRDCFANMEHPLAHHAVNTLIEEGRTSDEFVLRSKMLLAMRTGSMWSGEYRDRIVRTPEGWRFVERVAIRPRGLPAR